MKIGVRTARDLTWKDGLDAFTCTECGRCKDACPTFLTGKPLSLKWVYDSLKQHLLAQREAIVAGDDAALPALVGEVIAPETLWACTTCGYCEAACPIELEHLPRFYRMRQHQVLMEGAFPHELKAVFDAYEVQSNPWGLPADTRGNWANGLGVPIVQTRRRHAGTRLPVLRRLGGVVRSACAKDRGRVRQDPEARRRPVRDPRRARDVDRRMRAPRRQRDAVPAARARAGRDLERTGRDAHRDLRSACVQHAEERVSGVRRALRGRPSHAAHRAAHRRGPHPRRPRPSSASSTTSRVISRGTTANTRRRARSSRS